MEASALHAPAGFARGRIALGLPLLRLRSDEQLVALFRDGDEEAFRVIHDRYRTRLFAYARQMLGSNQDAEDVLQDVFVRAYAGLRLNDRNLALRAWLYRVAHNRCVDQLRRPMPPTPEALGRCLAPTQDPATRAEERDSLRRLIADLRRLPDQQRSALLMRELGGMSYDELSMTLAISLPAVKSVLVRARVSLAQAVEARETACEAIREELILAHDGRRRPAALARRHLRDCPGCCEFRREMRGASRQLAALTPTLGPLGVLANALGLGGGGAAAGGSVAAGSGVLTGGGAVAGGLGHVATILAAAAVTAGGAVEIQHQLATVASPRPVHHLASRPAVAPVATFRALAASVGAGTGLAPAAVDPPSAAADNAPVASANPPAPAPARSRSTPPAASRDTGSQPLPASALTPGMGPGPGGGADPVVPNATASPGAAANAAGPAGTGPGSSTATAPTGSGAATTPPAATIGAASTPSSTATAPSASPTGSSTAGTAASSTQSGAATSTGSGTSTMSAAKSSGTSRS